MRKVGLFEAKQKLSELVDRAARGEGTASRARKLVASSASPQREADCVKSFTIRENSEALEKDPRSYRQELD